MTALELSFWTKKNLVPTGEDEERISAAVNAAAPQEAELVGSCSRPLAHRAA